MISSIQNPTQQIPQHSKLPLIYKKNMRTREEITKKESGYVFLDQEVGKVLEVLLDIRDLLPKQPS